MELPFTRPRSRLDDLETEAERLRREIASLRTHMSRRAAERYDEATDAASDLYHRLERGAEQTGRELARGARRAVRDNPAATAIVGIAAIAFLVALLMRR